MNEDTAQVTVTLLIKLTAEAGATPEQPGISAEDKAQTTVNNIKDMVQAIKRTYDTGVEIMPGSKVVYVSRDEQVLN